MLAPKKVKHRKTFKGKIKGNAKRGSLLSAGSFGLKTLEEGWITDRQIEAARVALTRHLKREGQVWINIFPDKPITKKPAEVRMGKGKGAPVTTGLKRESIGCKIRQQVICRIFGL